jgi:hypothetical protein
MDLEAIAPILQTELQKVLEQKRYPFGFAKKRGIGNKVASGKLRDSISVVVKNNNTDKPTIQVLAEDYFAFVQSGRLPGKKGVPISAIEDWIKSRGLQGRDKKGRYIKRRSFAFAIQTNIKKFGIRPANFLDVAIEDLAQDQRIVDAIGEAAFEELVDLIEGI